MISSMTLMDVWSFGKYLESKEPAAAISSLTDDLELDIVTIPWKNLTGVSHGALKCISSIKCGDDKKGL